MTTPVSICSGALVMLGDKPIASLTENTDRARMAANLYPDERAGFLRAHPWNAAIKRVTLSPSSTAPAFDSFSVFDLPSDCMRVLSVGSENDSRGGYRVEGRSILYPGAVAYLRYVADVPESMWDAHMILAMKTRMAALMSYAVTGSATLAQSWLEQSKTELRTAKTTDGQEDPPEDLDDGQLLESRSIGGGW